MSEKIISTEGKSKCYREDKNGWIFVHLEGSASTRGSKFGFLLADEII